MVSAIKRAPHSALRETGRGEKKYNGRRREREAGEAGFAAGFQGRPGL